MRSLKLLFCYALILAALAWTLPVGAHPVSKSIDLFVPAKIGRTQLDVGQYKIIIDATRVTVKQGKKVIAETTGEFVERTTRQTNNAVLVSRTGQIEEIRFAGDKRVLVLHN
jgi:hypothetical protein